MTDVIEITLIPHTADRFKMVLSDGTMLPRSSRQPRLDGARQMLKDGWSPETLITTRHQANDYPNWKPAPIGELAEWTIGESDKCGLSRRRWKPFSSHHVRPESSDEASSVVVGHTDSSSKPDGPYTNKEAESDEDQG